MKKIDIKEFRVFGFLQEANRKFFHPLGLALEIKIDDKGNETIGGIWDCRENDGGIIFAENIIDIIKINNIKKNHRRMARKRKKLFGYIIQKK